MVIFHAKPARTTLSFCCSNIVRGKNIYPVAENPGGRISRILVANKGILPRNIPGNKYENNDLKQAVSVEFHAMIYLKIY
jgi:hypothetical protein